jgi:phospholipid transport system transporter-binding protein
MVNPVATGPVEAATLLETSAGRYALRGSLAFATARVVHEKGRNVILGASTGVLEFDCGGLIHTDSAGVAVLIDWLAVAKHRGQRLRYLGISDSVRAIARISEVDELLESGV